MLLFFAWLTYYTMTCDPFTEVEFVNEIGETYMATPECVLECGCFGNAIPLTPKESFIKDLILLFFAIFPFLGAFVFKNQKLNESKEDIVMVVGCLVFTMLFGMLMLDWLFPILFSGILLAVGILVKKYSGRKEWLMALALLVVVGWFQYHTLNHLPVKDYRPYAIGVNIPQDMQSAAERGLTPPVYITMYKMVNKETGETFEVSSTQYSLDRLWENKALEIEKSWGPIEVEPGYEPPIPPDFEFTNAEGVLMTDSIIYDKGYVFLHVAYDLETTCKCAQKDLNEFAEKGAKDGHTMYALSNSGLDVIEDYRHEHQTPYEFLIGDEKILKTIVRANPGLVILKDGIVINKYHCNDVPNYEDAKADNFQP
ncbi:MAG: hypothetical protein ACPGWM_11210, partial [Flavobacteriales bacterium]